MIFRRIKAHIEKENWFAVGVDFFIVVVGVFVGMQAQDWNESRGNKRIVAEYIERLQAEILIENQSHQNVIDYLSTTHAHGIAALESFKKPADELDKDFLIDLYQASQSWNYRPNLSTYNELLTTGRIGLFSDDNVRKAVSGYFAGRTLSTITIDKNTSTAFRTTIRSYMDNDVQTQIRNKCGGSYTLTKNAITYMKMPKSCDIDISDDLTKSQINELHTNAVIRRDLNFHIGSTEAALGSLVNGINAGNTALAQLKVAGQ